MANINIVQNAVNNDKNVFSRHVSEKNHKKFQWYNEHYFNNSLR